MRACSIIGNRAIRAGLASCLMLLGCLVTRAASAADCPGHPDAIGTSRTLVVDPREHPRIGTMQYPETLPLADHEVVLTFDDGPLPRNSNKVLQILADQCVKATFFLIGEQARANPEGVRKLVAAGHTIGTHSEHHPLSFEKMPIDKVKEEVDQGIASVSAALSDPSVIAPFFRIPGLLRAPDVEDYLASKGIQTWSADFLADDWRRISSARVADLAIKRLEAKHKGILLLHDIQARTVAALPTILQEMKARGYRIVQVVPATPERPATPTEPEQWQLHPTSETVPIARWPKVPGFVFAETGMLAAPALSDFDVPDGRLLLTAEPFDRVRRAGQHVPWPRQTTLSPQNAAVTLPVPAASLFKIPEKTRAMLQPFPVVARRADQTQSIAQQTKPEARPHAAIAGARALPKRAAAKPQTRVAHGVHQAKPHRS